MKKLTILILMLIATSAWSIEVKILENTPTLYNHERGTLDDDFVFLCISVEKSKTGYMYVKTSNPSSSPTQMFRRGQNNSNGSTPIECSM